MTEDTNTLGALGRLFSDTFNVDVPARDTDLLDTGILDSFQFVELLFQLERQFGLEIEIEDIDLDDLRTLQRIARLIERTQARDAAVNHPKAFVQRQHRL